MIEAVCHSRDVKELLSQKVENQRKENRISGREFMSYDDDDNDNEIEQEHEDVNM